MNTRDTPEQVEVAYRAIERLVNGYSDRDVQALALTLANDHPTLQQGYMRLVYQFLKLMAAKTYTDARNEGSVKWARQIIQSTGEYGPSLPLI